MNLDALFFHETPPHGKLKTEVSKPIKTQSDLALAYSPGVAQPCKKIAENPENIYKYTWKGNLVAVISDGTAVLGLGDIGADASLPVMEGKSALFKSSANIDSVPLVIDRNTFTSPETESIIQVIQSLAVNFGGINLEDIHAPDCFEIEKELKKTVDIPVFHDDQHGTAIVVLAGIINSLKITNRKNSNTRIVINGAGAAGIATALFLRTAGFKKENIMVCDSRGVISESRADELNPYKKMVMTQTDRRTLTQALEGADVFIGVSRADILKPEMIAVMNQQPIIFALANPKPEIDPMVALENGAHIVATGRTDYPNQINNILGFPGIFRGALDVRAKQITEKMKVAAAYAIADVTSQTIPQDILSDLRRSYPNDDDKGIFEKKAPLCEDYIVPKPTDPRVVPAVAAAVAEAAMSEGIARKPIDDIEHYESSLYKQFFA